MTKRSDLDACVVSSRSDAVRCSLRELIDKHRRRMTGEAIVQGYVKHPQTEEELAWAHDNAIAMIEEEPW